MSLVIQVDRHPRYGSLWTWRLWDGKDLLMEAPPPYGGNDAPGAWYEKRNALAEAHSRLPVGIRQKRVDVITGPYPPLEKKKRRSRK